MEDITITETKNNNIVKSENYGAGLRLITLMDGLKQWQCIYRINSNEQKVIIIGSRDDFSPSQARAKMRQIKRLASLGINPKICLRNNYATKKIRLTFEEWLASLED